MTSSKRALCAFVLALAWVAPAAPGDTPGQLPVPGDLPPAAAVMQALGNHPLVRAAQAEMRGAQAEHRRLRAGSHEYGLRLGMQRRTVSGGPEHGEWEVAVERGIRLPEKGRLDERIGAQGVAEAEERIGDARHEAARQLLAAWYAALQAQAEARLWDAQGELLAKEKRIVEVRLKKGDAARLDGLQVDAALAQARARSRQAAARYRASLAELQALYPELSAPDGGKAVPELPTGAEADWIAHTLGHNHELQVVQHTLEKARLQARRLDAERRPDPTLGLRYANEQGGDERVLGLTLALPLPGEGRRAQAASQLAQAEALAEMEAATRRRLAAEAAVNWQRAHSAWESWQRLGEAAEALARHADLAQRAHELGELGLSEALLARRHAQEGQLAAEQARLAANEAIARLLLDAHRLWPLGDGGEHH